MKEEADKRERIRDRGNWNGSMGQAGEIREISRRVEKSV
jgi:hypothetical protein